MDPSLVTPGNSNLFGTAEKVLDVVNGFVCHPTSAAVGSSTGSVPLAFHEVVFGEASPHTVTQVETSPEAVAAYTYSGNCKRGGELPTVNNSFGIKVNQLYFNSVDSVTKGEIAAVAPKMLFSDVVDTCKAAHGTLDWGDANHNGATINIIMACIDRVQRLEQLQAAIVPKVMLPTDNPVRNNVKITVVVIKAKSPQSYGTMMKVKDRDRDKGYCTVHIAAEVDVASGLVLRSNGSGHGGYGVFWTQCKCKSPYKFCRHVIVLLIAISRLDETQVMTATTGTSYWKGMSRTNPVDQDERNRALPIAELTPNYTYLSDVHGRQVQKEDMEGLFGYVHMPLLRGICLTPT